MQLSKEQIEAPLTQLNSGDALLGLQLVSRLFRLGAVKESEMASVGVFRNRLVLAFNAATGLDYDGVIEELEKQAASAAQQAAAPVVNNIDPQSPDA